MSFFFSRGSAALTFAVIFAAALFLNGCTAAENAPANQTVATPSSNSQPPANTAPQPAEVTKL